MPTDRRSPLLRAVGPAASIALLLLSPPITSLTLPAPILRRASEVRRGPSPVPLEASPPSVAAAAAASDAPAAPPPTLLAKTAESFRLSDLYALEARIQSEAGGYGCERIDVDPATGSCLLRVGGLPLPSPGQIPIPPLPSSLRRCDWLAEVLAAGTDAVGLLGDVRRHGGLSECGSWALEYLCTSPNGPAVGGGDGDSDGGSGGGGKWRGNKGYNSKTLMCCVSQALSSPAALDPERAAARLILVEARSGMYLARKLPPSLRGEAEGGGDGDDGVVDGAPRAWSRRPFQYSSAIHPAIAASVADLLLGMARPTSPGRRRRATLLDPTCGSGTFLARALLCGMDAVGWDANPSCVEGTERNLEYMYGGGDGEGDGSAPAWRVEVRDATLPLRGEGPLDADCVAANLPWGQSSIDYYRENESILGALGRSLRPGTPCAFVGRGADLRHCMAGLGYRVLGSAHIPPRDFKLPGSKKRWKGTSDEGGAEHGRKGNDCFVTIALSPQLDGKQSEGKQAASVE